MKRLQGRNGMTTGMEEETSPRCRCQKCKEMERKLAQGAATPVVVGAGTRVGMGQTPGVTAELTHDLLETGTLLAVRTPHGTHQRLQLFRCTFQARADTTASLESHRLKILSHL
mmetsp:Transcript_6418/g.40100  ORF Transcript_6418/g.40100 Transcript_6418/m.40100 type:complete len:114 (+) Transcript_6418:130-471(+)